MKKQNRQFKLLLNHFNVRALVTSKPRSGFGSFHSEDIELLIRQSDEVEHDPFIIETRNKTLDLAKNYKNVPYGCRLKEKMFSLDSSWNFMNHGAFGATLLPLQQESDTWRKLIELQPLRFYDRLLLPQIAFVMRTFAKYFNCDTTELVPLQNVTTGLNSIINSVDLQPNDEVMCFSLTYGSTKKMLSDVCIRNNAKLIIVPLLLPIQSKDDIIQKIKEHLNSRIKLVIIDHITSNTAIVLPYLEIAQICKTAGAIVVIDAAHSLFSQSIQIYPKNLANSSETKTDSDSEEPLSISKVADFWLTNGHKWFCAPKGCAFMWISPAMKDKIRPAIISHGFQANSNPSSLNLPKNYSDPNRILSGFSWDGCRDYSALLCLPSALQLWNESRPNGIPGCRNYMKDILKESTDMISTDWNVPETEFAAPYELKKDSPMSLIPLPDKVLGIRSISATDQDAFTLQEELHHKYRIEVPVKCIEKRLYVRISAHIYNEIEQYKELSHVVKAMTEAKSTIVDMNKTEN